MNWYKKTQTENDESISNTDDIDNTIIEQEPIIDNAEQEIPLEQETPIEADVNLIEDIKQYDTFEDFSQDYEVLYHGGSKNIVGNKLSTNARIVGEITEDNLGTGQDYGGIFFTPEKQLAETFARHTSAGDEGGVHTFVVKKNEIFDDDNPNHAKMLADFVGQKYLDVDGYEDVFSKQMYDYIYPLQNDGHRHMDWATMDPEILHAVGFKGAKVVENYDVDDKHLYSTVLFEGGQDSPHWKVENDTQLIDIWNKAHKQANRKNWYKKAQQKNPWEMSVTGPEYSAMSIEDLDRAAFGFNRNDIKTLNPNQINIKWKDDWNNVIAEQQSSGLDTVQWAKNIDLSEPIDVIYENGQFKVDDGHHRFYAAKILNVKIPVNVEIKDKPHRAIIEKALSEGKIVPDEVLKDYPDLINFHNKS